MSKAAFIGEVGLEARSKVPDSDQERVLAGVLHAAASEGVVVSLHSSGRSSRVLDFVEASGCRTAVLHWWGGTPAETERAIALNCHFSVNAAMRDEVIRALPHDLVMTETDFPATRSRDASISRPGAVGSIESHLAGLWGVDTDRVRESGWEALRRLDAGTHRLARMTASMTARSPHPG
jgi:TatD DNase family protein